MPTTASSDVFDQQMAKAMGHPERVRIMAEFSGLGRAFMSASEYARRHNLDISYCSHHFRTLERWGFIEEAETRRVRGAVEYFYRSKRKLILEGPDWEQLPLEFRESVSGRTLNNLWNTVAEAVESGTIERRPAERVVGWDRITLDERGWKKLAGSFRKLMDEATKASEESEARLSETGGEGITAGWGLLLFEVPSKGRTAGGK
jgi:Helix-turn-helix domain